MAAADLVAALAAVRFAVSAEPAAPMLGGILFDLDGELLRLVATDRYRLAVGAAPAARRPRPSSTFCCRPRSPTSSAPWRRKPTRRAPAS